MYIKKDKPKGLLPIKHWSKFFRTLNEGSIDEDLKDEEWKYSEY